MTGIIVKSIPFDIMFTRCAFCATGESEHIKTYISAKDITLQESSLIDPNTIIITSDIKLDNKMFQEQSYKDYLNNEITVHVTSYLS